MKPALKVVGVAALVLVTGVAVALAFPAFWLEPLLENRLSARLDRQVQIDGSVDLSVFDPPAIMAEDVAVANPAWAQEPWLLQAQTLRVTFSADALWSFSLKPVAIGLDQPRLFLARNGDGGTTWDVAGLGGGQSQGSGDSGRDLDRLTVDDGRFRYRDPGQDTDLTGTLSTTADGTAYDASGTYKERETEASGTGGDLLVLLRGRAPWPLEAEVTAGGHDVSLQGTATGLPAPTGLDLTIAGAGPSLAGLGELVGGGLPTSPPYDLAGRLTLTDGRWQFSDASGTIGESAVAGLVAVEPAADGGPTRLTVDLSSGHMEVADIAAVLGEPGVSEGPAQIPAEALRAYRADVTLKADELVVAGRALPDARIQARLENGRLTVDPLMAGVGDGRMQGRAELAAGSPPTVAVSLELNRLELNPLAGVEAVRGVFGGTVDLESSGATVEAMRGNLSGRVALLLSDGRLTRQWLEMAQIGLSDLTGLFIPQEDDATAIRCAAAGFDVSNGVAEATALYADTEAAVVRGDGAIDLRDLTLDLAFTMDPKGAVTLAYDGPVHVTGPISDPSIEAGGVASTVLQGLGAVALGTVLTPVAAVAPFIDTSVGAEGGCRQALDETVAEQEDGTAEDANDRKDEGG
ncbi:AsmA family protein [Caenispirillum salinarum]|uniref:AsmA family protein n=1 Tax=Caenispirillum salinarum TaxID=859058 RepID=UPI00384C60BA